MPKPLKVEFKMEHPMDLSASDLMCLATFLLELKVASADHSFDSPIRSSSEVPPQKAIPSSAMSPRNPLSEQALMTQARSQILKLVA